MLQDKRIVITGAAGTLGQAAAACAQGKGAHVIGLDIVETPSLSNTEEYYRVDLLNAEAVNHCMASLGSIDALLNIAGGFAMGVTASDPSDEQWELMFRLNVTTMRNATRAAVPALSATGKAAIVNVGALGALSGAADMSAYCAAKSTVMRLTESFSEELKNKGVNVNAVLPSIINTPPNREAMPDADFDDWVSPEKLAEVMCFLASDSASAVHGVLLPVKGLV
jgi:NAD(P)-dependent dehydrogenase (short-subunit alcohol dehydrogenase family)